MLKEKAVENFLKKGYSCSESVALAAYECGLTKENLLTVSGSFSGAMSSGCLCGAVAASQLVIGHRYGRENAYNSTENVRAIAKEFIDRFKAKHKVTCCRVLTANFDFHSPERKQHCSTMVADCCDILESLIKEIEEKKTTV